MNDNEQTDRTGQIRGTDERHRDGSDDGTDDPGGGGERPRDQRDDRRSGIGDVSEASASLPDAEHIEEALDGERAAGEGPAGVAETETRPDTADETRVLEFTLDGEYYCLDIEHVEEIVEQETITRVPNTPAVVEGVVDLRGQITTILNPKVTIGKEDDEAGDLIVVFDSETFDDQGHVGWVVDDVRQVSPVAADTVDDPPVDDDHINGVIDREGSDQFVVWATPELALAEAEG